MKNRLFLILVSLFVFLGATIEIASVVADERASETPSERADAQTITGRKTVKITPKLALELSIPEETFACREIADYRTASGGGAYICEDEFGYIRKLPGASVVSVEDAPDLSVSEAREKISKSLLAEFGTQFSVKTTKSYLFVSDASEGYVEWCSRLFENLTDGFSRYAKRNGFELKERVEPMVVVIFARRDDFMRYASRETPGADQVAAYYNLETNRVVLYDLSQVEGETASPTRRRRTYLETREFLSRPNAAFNTATIVHEATHQIAYNSGVFLRTGPFALWTVEGLSLLFETPNGRASQDGWGYRSNFPTNERQLELFRQYAANSQGSSFRELVRQENFNVDIRASYARSWALFFYLYKKRPKELAGYMKEIANKPPSSVYSPEDRVEDFESYFGDDWDKLNKDLLKFIKRL